MAKKRSRRPWRRLLTLLVLAVVGVGVWRHYRGGAVEPPEGGLTSESDRIHRVARGNFEIVVHVDGTIDAIRRHNLIMKARRGGGIQLTLMRLVDDNSHVKAGDVIMECEPAKFVEKIEDIEKNIEDNLKDLDLKRDQLEMQRATNLSNLKSAVDTLRNAEDALEKYTDLDARKTRRDQQEAIDDKEIALEEAESALATAEAELRDSQGKAEDVVAKAETAAANAKKTSETASAAVDTAFHNQRVWRQYDHPQKLRALEQGVDQARLKLRQQTMSASSSTFQIERELRRLELRSRQLSEELTKYREDLANLVVTAPIDGIVSLGDVNRPHWRQPKEWKIGAEVNTGEIVASIPDLSAFLVKCQIPEEHRSRIRLDQPARCLSSAIPDLVMNGKLGEIHPVPVNVVRWDQNSPKVYESKIFTDTSHAELIPGMSVKVELIVEEVKDVLFVPVEAVYSREANAYVKVRGAFGSVSERSVKTGRSSLDYVEIIEGLEEGEDVLLINTAFDTP